MTPSDTENFVYYNTQFARQINANAHDKGFYDGVEFNVGEKLMLVVTELAEAMEGFRCVPPKLDEHCPAFQNVEIEIADAMIRLFDFAQEAGLRVFDAMLAKHAFNKTRPRKHGKTC